jgi:predicted N-acetyltransferase YhbS
VAELTFPVLDDSSSDAVAALLGRAVADPPDRDETRKSLFVAEQPATVRGDPDVGVVATVEWEGGGHVRLLAVDPAHRGRGVGRALLRAAEADLRARGLTSCTIGADPPFYLWPGVPVRELALLCLLEREKYQRTEAAFNMDVDLHRIPDDPGGWTVATAADRDDVTAWCARWWPNWAPESLRALEQAGLVIARDEQGISAVCAHDVNRRGLVGPVAVRHDLMGKGAGVGVLIGALHRMRDAGQESVEISWVGPIVPYARVGGTVGRVFFGYRKELR